jgi:hypothetical protein
MTIFHEPGHKKNSDSISTWLGCLSIDGTLKSHDLSSLGLQLPGEKHIHSIWKAKNDQMS